VKFPFFSPLYKGEKKIKQEFHNIVLFTSHFLAEAKYEAKKKKWLVKSLCGR